MLHAITKQLQTFMDINVGISKVDHHKWMFTSRIVRLALEITFFT